MEGSKTMPRFLRIGMIMGTAMFALAACDESDAGDGGDNGNVGQIEDNFGTGFAQAFAQDPNDEPIDPQPDDIVAVDFTSDPIDF